MEAGDESEGQAGAAALQRLYDQHAHEVYGFAVARLGSSDAEDLTAEVFHAAVVALTDGRSKSVDGAWLMTVARNKVVDRWRRASVRRSKDHLIAVREDDTFPDEWAAAERREAVLAALDALPAHQRSALVMRHLEGYSVPEVAEAMSLSVRAAESLLARARRAFRALHDEGEAP